MKEDTLLKIGDFARLAQVSIATLRHYDQYGLLKPSILDQQTGYRYYALDQLPRLNRILALKDLGFPLPQIVQLLEEELSFEQLQGMFRLKQAQVQEVISIEQARLSRIAVRLQQIEQEGTMPTYDPLLKQVEPLLVATRRTNFSIDANHRQYFEEFAKDLDHNGIPYVQSYIVLWHSRFQVHGDGMYADLEVAIPLRGPLMDAQMIDSRILPGGFMACTVHTGNLLFLGQAHKALSRWMEEHGYRLAGPPRQIHFQIARLKEPVNAVTEMQFPVEKL